MRVASIFPYVSVNELRDEAPFLQDGRLVFTNINTQEDFLAASKIRGDR